MNAIERVITSIRRRGWWETARLAPERLAAHFSREGDRWFDLRHGTVTGLVVELDDLDVTSENKARGIRYEPTRARPLRKLLDALHIPTNGAFVDFGCGMGRVLLIAADYGFHRIVGVDFSERLCRQARSNVDHYTRAAGKRISIVHADATRYAIQPDERVFYFFNPFDAGLMEEVLDRILASHAAHPRDLWLIYHNPVWRRVFDGRSQVVHHSEHRFADCRFVVYRVPGQ